MIFLDQPIGTGFSYGSDKVKSSREAAEGVYAFLRILFFAYPKYASLSFHVAGESYAGHYIPEIAKVIIDKSQQTKYINLKSIMIGNGIVDALVQNKYYADMAEDTKYGPVLPQNEIKRMRKNYPKCKNLVEKCYQNEDRRICKRSAHYCAQINFLAFDWLTDLSVYDIRKKSDYYDKYNEGIETFLNQKHIQKQLGVSLPFAGCSDKVFDRFDKFGDESRPIVWDIPSILDAGIRVLIYAGDADYICNWIGNKAWTMNLEWSGSKGFKCAEDKIWKSEMAQKDGGELRNFENLYFLRVYEAGHFVPFDQPKVSLDFFNAFIMDKL